MRFAWVGEGKLKHKEDCLYDDAEGEDEHFDKTVYCYDGLAVYSSSDNEDNGNHSSDDMNGKRKKRLVKKSSSPNCIYPGDFVILRHCNADKSQNANMDVVLKVVEIHGTRSNTNSEGSTMSLRGIQYFRPEDVVGGRRPFHGPAARIESCVKETFLLGRAITVLTLYMNNSDAYDRLEKCIIEDIHSYAGRVEFPPNTFYICPVEQFHPLNRTSIKKQLEGNGEVKESGNTMMGMTLDQLDDEMAVSPSLPSQCTPANIEEVLSDAASVAKSDGVQVEKKVSKNSRMEKKEKVTKVRDEGREEKEEERSSDAGPHHMSVISVIEDEDSCAGETIIYVPQKSPPKRKVSKFSPHEVVLSPKGRSTRKRRRLSGVGNGENEDDECARGRMIVRMESNKNQSEEGEKENPRISPMVGGKDVMIDEIEDDDIFDDGTRSYSTHDSSRPSSMSSRTRRRSKPVQTSLLDAFHSTPTKSSSAAGPRKSTPVSYPRQQKLMFTKTSPGQLSSRPARRSTFPDDDYEPSGDRKITRLSVRGRVLEGEDDGEDLIDFVVPDSETIFEDGSEERPRRKRLSKKSSVRRRLQDSLDEQTESENGASFNSSPYNGSLSLSPIRRSPPAHIRPRLSVKESFPVYLQYLVSALMAEDFEELIASAKDEEYFRPACEKIEATILSCKEQISSNIWKGEYVEYLKKYANFRSWDGVPDGKHCNACSRSNHSATICVIFAGPKYDSERLWRGPCFIPKKDKKSAMDDEVEIRVQLGKQCHLKSKQFHALQHYKYTLLCKIQKRLETFGVSDDQEDSLEKLLHQVLQDGWVSGLYEEFQGLLDEAKKTLYKENTD